MCRSLFQAPWAIGVAITGKRGPSMSRGVVIVEQDQRRLDHPRGGRGGPPPAHRRLACPTATSPGDRRRLAAQTPTLINLAVATASLTHGPDHGSRVARQLHGGQHEHQVGQHRSRTSRRRSARPGRSRRRRRSGRSARRPRQSTADTTGLKCAPETGPNSRISTPSPGQSPAELEPVDSWRARPRRSRGLYMHWTYRNWPGDRGLLAWLLPMRSSPACDGCRHWWCRRSSLRPGPPRRKITTLEPTTLLVHRQLEPPQPRCRAPRAEPTGRKTGMSQDDAPQPRARPTHTPPTRRTTSRRS